MRNLQRDASVAVDISPLIRLIDQRPPRTTTMSAFKPLQTRALPCRMTHDQISDLIPDQSRDGRGGRAPGGVRRCACDHRGGDGGRRVRVRRWQQRGVDPVLVAGDGSVSPQTYPGSELDGGFAVLEVPTRAEAVEWASKIAAACRCSQELREFMYDPGSEVGADAALSRTCRS